jgi:hypothetical protein
MTSLLPFSTTNFGALSAGPAGAGTGATPDIQVTKVLDHASSALYRDAVAGSFDKVKIRL